MCLFCTKITRVKIDLRLVLAEQWRRMCSFIARTMSRNRSVLLIILVIDNNTTILAIIWKPRPLKWRRKIFHPENFAFGLKKKHLKNKEVSKIGKSIFQDKNGVTSFQQHIVLQVASAISKSGKMSKHMYTDICILLKGAGVDVLSTNDKLDKFRRERRPEVEKLQDPFEGVKFDYVQYLQLTTGQLIRSLELVILYSTKKCQQKSMTS